eukprot:tig00000158_g10161.t1
MGRFRGPLLAASGERASAARHLQLARLVYAATWACLLCAAEASLFRAGALSFSATGYNAAKIALLEPASGVLYVGLDTIPARIVNPESMQPIVPTLLIHGGSQLLADGSAPVCDTALDETSVAASFSAGIVAGALDASGSASYWALGTSPGTLIRVQTAATGCLTWDQNATAQSGDADFVAVVSHQSYVYASTSDDPPVVYQFAASDLTEAARLVVVGSSGSVRSAVLISSLGLAGAAFWSTSGGCIVRTDLGVGSSFSQPGTPTCDSALDLLSLSSHPQGWYIYAGTSSATAPGQIRRYDTSTPLPTFVDSVTFSLAAEKGAGPLLFDPYLSSAYALAYDTGASTPYVVRLSVSSTYALTYVSSLAMAAGEGPFGIPALSLSQLVAYYPRDTSPGGLVRVNLRDVQGASRVGSLEVSGAQNPGVTYTLTESSTKAPPFVVPTSYDTSATPTWIYLVWNPTTAEATKMLKYISGSNSFEGRFISLISGTQSFPDIAVGVYYKPVGGSPPPVYGSVWLVQGYNGITRSGIVRVEDRGPSDNNWGGTGTPLYILQSSEFDIGVGDCRVGFVHSGYAYFGMYATNGSVARVDLEVPLGDAGWQTSISTSLNGGSVTSGALDSSAGRGYFGTAYGCVVRFLLQQLSQTFAMSNVLCGLGSDPLTSAAVDPANAFLYLGSSAASDATATTGATLYKVRLSDFTLVASLALHSAGNTGAMSATTGYADWILRSIAIPTGETAFISVDTGTDSATSPAALVAVYLGGSYSNSMRRLSTFRTQAGIAEGRLTGAILAGHDPSGYFKAYYTAWSDPARIIRIFLYTPALTSVAPSDGPFAGGNAVTYGGTGMLPSVAGHTATLGTGAVTALSIASFTSISGTLPTSGFAAGRPTFTLTSPAFGSVTSSLYTVNPAATIASAVPNNGPYARNVTVTITGTNFLLQDPTLHLSLVLTTNPTTVVSTLSTTIVSTTTLRSVLRGSAAAAGAYDLELTSPRFGTATLASGYTVNPPATISYSVPADGPWSGGNQITIFGTNFLTPDTSIAASVGAVAASGVAPLNATAFVLTVPASNATFVSLAPGTYNVSAASDRFGDAFADAVYTVNPPATVTAVSPTDGPYNGNRVVTVFGTNFFAVDPGIVAAFGAAYTTTTVTLVNSTQLEFLAPTMAMAAGLYDVVLTSPRFGVANGSQLFTVNPQAFVDYTIPADWSYNGGVSLTIFGRNFFEAEAGVAVTVGGASCTSVVVLNATAINVTLPVPIPYAVSNPPMVVESYRFGTANSTYFRVNPPMNVTSVTPTNGPLRGNTTVTISGTGFPLDDPTVVLSLGGAPWTNFTISSSTQILATIPSYPLPAGTYAVGITAERYGSATLAGGYTLNPAATIASVYPAEGGDGGGNFVTLTGTNFFAGEAGLYATFNSLVTASVTALSTTRLLVVTPRGADVGYPLITVYSARFGEATTSSYRVFPEPYISYSVPSDGPFVGGNRITLFGQNFVANETATEVDITIFTVGSPSVFRPPSFAVTSNTTIEARPPARPPAATRPDARGGAILTVPGVSLGAGLQNVTVDSIRFGFIWATVYTVNPQPTVASTSPSNLPSAECHGMAVTIIGTNFIVNDTVTARLGSVTLENVTVVSGTSLGGVLPATGAFPVGGVTVTISSTRTGSATRANGFTFNPRAPRRSRQRVPVPRLLRGLGRNRHDRRDTVQSPTVGLYSGGKFGTPQRRQHGRDERHHGYADWILRRRARSARVAIPPSEAGRGRAQHRDPDGETAFISVDTGTDSATSPAALVAVYLGGSYSNSMRRLSTFRTQAGIAEGRLTGAILAGHDPSGYFKAYYTAWSDPARIIRIFLYTPALTSVAPSDGPFAGGNAVTYGGTGMLPSVAGHTATLGTGAVTALSIASFTSISGTLPTSGFAAGRPTFTLTSPRSAPRDHRLRGPNNGPYARNVTVTITGTNFLLQDPTLHLSLVLTTNPTTVVSTLSTTIVSTTTLRSVLRGSAAAAGAYDLELTSPRFGTATLASGYTVNPPATISYSVPADGPWSGGNQITIFGTNFLTPDTSIAASVGAVAASGVAPLNATAFVLTVPASNATFVSLAPGTYNVSAASDRFGDAFADAVYTVNPPATVTAVSPTDGPYNGNRVVTVFGTNFFAVDPGIVAAFGAAYTTTTVTLVNSTQLEFLAPTMAMAAGLYDVVLTSPRFGVANGSQLFTVNPAFVDYTIPADWSYNGGVSLTIFGRNFFEAEAGVAVTVGGASCTSVVVLNATAINVTLPVPIPYAVSNPPMVVESYRFGTANSTYFRVNPRALRSLFRSVFAALMGRTSDERHVGDAHERPAARQHDGHHLRDGLPLDDPTVVLSLGGAPWTNFTISSSTQILATIPSYPLPAGTYAVGITAERYGSATLAGGRRGGNFVTLTGTNFFAGEAGLYATFNSLVTASVTALSTTRLLVVTPRGADVGYPLITVYSARFGEATTSSYRVFPEPYISYSVPSDGPFVGGNRITLFGQNFVANETATEVDITIFTVGSPSVFRPPSFAVTSNTTIEARPPARPPAATRPDARGGAILTVPGVSLGAGLQNVTVDSIRFGFIWATVYTVNPQPTVASTSPSNLPSAECHGMAVTIIGTNFIVNDTVTARLGSVTLENVTVVSGTSLGGVLPATGAFPVGGVTVTISSTRTGSATRANGFTFNPPATIGLIRPTSAPFASSTATVTILGTGFFTVDPGINATVGATYPPASNIQLFTTTRIQLVVSPASLGVGQHPIRLLSPRFGTALSPTNFTVNPPGAIASVIPNSRPVSGGYSVTILGENLGGGDVSFVSLAGVPAVAITFQNSTCVEVTTGAGPALISGGPVALLSPTFGNTTQDGLFSLTCETDTICIAEPKTGPAAGGTTVTIYGDNVSDGAAGDVTAASVTFGSVAAASLVSFSATQVVVTTAASTTTTGPVDVTVVSLSKGSKTLARGFTYRPLLGKPRAVGTMDARESQASLVCPCETS